MDITKSKAFRQLGATLAISLVWLAPLNTWATLPKPIQASGIVLAVDQETDSLVFKRPLSKPVVLDWGTKTKFIENGRRVTSNSLKPDTKIVVSYQRLSFRNPLLKEVRWSTQK